MDHIREFADTTDFPVERYLQVNSVGSERVIKHSYTILRSKGRKDYHFLYVKNGFINAEVGNVQVRAGAGQCIVFLPGVRQMYTFADVDNPVSYFVHFTGTVAAEIFSCVPSRENMVYDVVDRTAFEGLFHQLVYTHNIQPNTSIPEENGILLQLIAILVRSSKEKAKQNRSDILFAASYIREHFHERINIAECASSLHLSVSRFAHLFTETVGVSPHKFILWLRIDKAKELLLYSSMNIGEVAESVGFNDSLYFSRIFRRHTGTSPQHFRKYNSGLSG